MSTVYVYTFEDESEDEDTYSTQSIAEAREYAQRYARALIANEYEWTDSELIEDYRPTTTLDEDGPE